jgi:Ala-tRNA(Pro) deacylase
VPATPDDLFARLAGLGISTTTLHHPPAFTVEELAAAVGHLPGVSVKNLFFADAKKKMWLVVIPSFRRIDLKKLAGVIGAARLSFGSPDRLMRVLGVTPGSVTPFAVINDPTAQVQVILDADMMTAPIINAHPLINTMTTSIAPADLMRFIQDCGHRPRLADLAPAAPA